MLAQGASAAPVLTRSGLPFPTGEAPASVAFDPTTSYTGKRWLAAANALDDSVSMYEASAEGVLTSVGPPVATGARPTAVAFSPSARLLAVSNSGDSEVSTFRLSPTGKLSRIDTDQTGVLPGALAFSPNGRLLATVNQADNSVSVFTVSAVGTLDAAAGSPVATGVSPGAVTFSPDGKLLATANGLSETVSIFSVTVGGELSLVGSTPTDRTPEGVTFSPDGGLLATGTGTSISVFSVSASGGLARQASPRRPTTSSRRWRSALAAGCSPSRAKATARRPCSR